MHVFIAKCQFFGLHETEHESFSQIGTANHAQCVCMRCLFSFIQVEMQGNLQSQITAKLQTMFLDCGVQKQHSTSKNCLISRVFVKPKNDARGFLTSEYKVCIVTDVCHGFRHSSVYHNE